MVFLITLANYCHSLTYFLSNFLLVLFVRFPHNTFLLKQIYRTYTRPLGGDYCRTEISPSKQGVPEYFVQMLNSWLTLSFCYTPLSAVQRIVQAVSKVSDRQMHYPVTSPTCTIADASHPKSQAMLRILTSQVSGVKTQSLN